jgi:predicted TIM-barrel fold metal-dependent hydrolase
VTATDLDSSARPDVDSTAVVVVSGDTHVGPLLAEHLRPYCPAEHLEAFDAFTAGAADMTALMKTVGLDKDEVFQKVMKEFSWNLQTDGHYDVHTRLADMDRDGVAVETVFHGSQNGAPIPFHSPVTLLGGVPEDERPMAAVGMQIYNRWLADYCSVQPERHIGLVHVPLWDMDTTLRELAWARENGLGAVNFPAPRPDLPAYEDVYWEPFFAACADLGLTLNTHVGGAGKLGPAYKGPGAGAIDTFEGPWYGRRGIWLLTFTGAFERHPNLRLVVTELPGAWWTDTVREMDAAYHSYFQGGSVRSALPHEPSYYVKRNIWMCATFQSRAEALGAIEGGHTDRIIWGSDYPHIEGTWRFPESPDEPSISRLSMANTFHDLAENDIRRMAGLNAVECFGLDLATVQPVAERIGPSLSELVTEPDLSGVPEGYRGFGFRSRGAHS